MEKLKFIFQQSELVLSCKWKPVLKVLKEILKVKSWEIFRC